MAKRVCTCPLEGFGGFVPVPTFCRPGHAWAGTALFVNSVYPSHSLDAPLSGSLIPRPRFAIRVQASHTEALMGRGTSHRMFAFCGEDAIVSSELYPG